MKKAFIVIFSLVFAMAFAIASATPDLRAVANAVDRKYNHLHTLQCNFTEIYSGAGMDRSETGTLWLKKPGKMRWEYRSPREKLFVGDGKYAWFYVPGEQQVRKTETRKLEDLRSPLAFLLGKTKLEKELPGLSVAQEAKPLNAGDIVLKGVPRAMAGRVTQVLLEITPEDWIRRIVIDEADGSRTEYLFSDQRADVKLPDQRFEFTVPKGVEVVDESFGQ